MTGLTADAALAGLVTWNAMACKALLFELRPEHSPQDGFIRNRSQGRKSRRYHQSLLVCAKQAANLHQRCTLQRLAIDIANSCEEAQTLSLAADNCFHGSFSRETAGAFHLPQKLLAGAPELVTDRSLHLPCVEIWRQTSRD